MNAIGIDISVFNTLMGNSKVTKYDLANVQNEIKRISKDLKSFLENSHTVDFETELLQKLSEFNNKYFPAAEYKYNLRQGKIDEKIWRRKRKRVFAYLQPTCETI